MPPPSSAQALFHEINGHTLSELLSSVLHQTSPLGSTLVPALDGHFRPGTDDPAPMSSCKRGDVIEVQGSAASGKTHFIYHMLINCILPPSYSSVKLHGWGKAAVLFDTDHKFNVQRFCQLLRSRARRLLPLDPPVAEAIITKSLDLLQIFRPSSSQQLAATVQHLPMYLATNLPEADLGVLAVDSISAFYWPDRYASEQLRSGAPSRASPHSQNSLYYALASIQSVKQSHGPLVLISTWDSNSFSTSRSDQYTNMPKPSLRPEIGIPGPRPLPITHHITFAPPKLSLGNGDNLADSTATSQFNGNTTSISGTARTPGSAQSTQFTLYITEDDILVP